jgi:hypothetical protein
MPSELEQFLSRVHPGLTPAEKQRLQDALAIYINELLVHDFSLLVQLLYCVDVNENKLKRLLQEHQGRDAAPVIAELLLERQLEKIKTRQQFKTDPNNIPEEDKW